MAGSKEGKIKDAASYVVSSVDRAAHLLLTLAEAPDSGVTELAAATQNTKSLTFRLLHTLERRGLVRKDAERRTYTLGYRALLLGDQTRRQSRLISTAEPILEEMSEISRENALLLVRENYHSICIAMQPSPEPLRIFAAVGRLGPLHVGGASKVLLAHAPLDIRRAVLSGANDQHAQIPVSDPAAIEAKLDAICADGYNISIGEIDPNIYSIAAPVRDQSGSVIAALAINGPTARLTEAIQEDLRQLVMRNADRLSQMLGWQ